MTSIGEALRRERIKRKLDLEGVSHELKISPRFLEAIEDEDFDKLPGRLFTRSFVRQYARLLGLDEDEIAGELKRLLDPQGSTPPAAAPTPPPRPVREPEIPLPRVESWTAVGDKPSRWSKSLPAFAMVVGVMLACSLAYSWLQRPRRQVTNQTVSKLAAADTASAPVSKTPAPAPVASDHPAATALNSQPDPKPANTAERQTTTATSPAPTPIPQSGLDPNAPVRVELTADDPVWISVKADGKNLYSGTLQPKEIKTAGANQNITIRVGNAGGLHISLNGKPIGPLGPKGQIRTVQLTSGGFQILVPEVSRPAVPLDVFDPL
ncbi:MAG TPA: RodZ domain-containing protein [Bryobacteraceae bacterium]|jgi:cytoskeletal protein RodZ